ncbi:hypothetical protein ONA23_05035 [Mycoplasmopsis cynos]|nr:hypothetical protein [Mycoplasmopsis cynos]WAM06331.1 hypothetical protein ONA23_05035 [Mycoplasmopsis cynos]
MKKSKNSLMSSKELYEKFKPTTIEEVYEIVKNNTKSLIQSIPEEEMKKHLGYDRYEHLKIELRIIIEMVHIKNQLNLVSGMLNWKSQEIEILNLNLILFRNISMIFPKLRVKL